MKKALFSLLSATALLCSTSCSDDAIVSEAGGEALVQFSVELNDGGVESRSSMGDGGNATELYYEVYATSGQGENLTIAATPLSDHDKKVKLENGRANVNLALVKNQTYYVVFWAQSEGAPYVDSDVKKQQLTAINMETLVSNDYNKDAFTAVREIKVEGAKSETVYLTRPFAQVNFGTTKADFKAALAAGMQISTSKVEASEVSATFNALTQTASQEVFVTEFEGRNVLTTGIEVEETEEGEKVEKFAGESLSVAGEEYAYLGTAYVFVPGDQATSELTMEIETGLNENITITVPNAPIRRNYRTNVLGNLLTNQTDFTVVVDAKFDGDINKEVWDGKSVEAPVYNDETKTYTVETPENLAWLAAAVNGTLSAESRAAVPADNFTGKTFVLADNVNLANQAWTPIGSNNNPFKGTFDGNGKTIYNLNVEMPGKSNAGLFGVTHDGEIKNVTVENAKVTGRLNVGVVAGTPYTSKYTNITVKGHVEVNGMAYVGAVGGKDAYANWTNVTVAADETSYVKAHSIENGTAYRTYVGGVVGFNGEGGHTFKNITSNIDVQGSTCDVGGLFGIAHYGNNFENCVCTGDVEIYAAEEAADAQEIGGIAGVWHNADGSRVTFTDCSFTGTLAANIEGVEFYNGGLVGKPYSATGTGTLVIDGNQYVNTAAQLQTALDAAKGETIIKLATDITGNVAAIQKQGVKVTIDGGEYKYNGQIKIHSNSNHYADAALTIKNVNFETSTASMNVIEALENGSERYSSNVTVENCTFTATGEAVNTSVGVQIKSSKNAKVLNCTATGMHSLIQAQSCDETVTVKGCAVNGKNGVAFKQVKAAIVDGCTIVALEYGIRFDGNTDNYGIVVNNNNVTAVQPFIVRKMTGKNNTIALEGTNTLTTEAEYQIVITNGSDDAEYVKPTGTYTLTGVAGYDIYPALVKDGNNTYVVYSAAGLVELAGEEIKGGETVKLAANIDLAGVEFNGLSAFNPEKNNTFDGQGYIVSNWTNNSKASDMGFIKSWVGTIKNVKFENCHLKTSGRSAIVAGKTYANIENVTVNNCSIEDSFWACGLVAGLYNSGNVSNCTVTNSSVKSNGGTAAVVGVVNETAGTRSFTNCKVEGCTINNTGVYGEVYSGAVIAGMINISNSTVKFVGCSQSNNTLQGNHIYDAFAPADDSVTIVIE